MGHNKRSTISKTKKKTFPEYFSDNGEQIQDKIIIANQFNNSFTNIGPNLVNQLNVYPENNYK